MNKHTHTKGFTLVEMVLTVLVLAILGTISFPTLIGFLRQRDVTNEAAAQQQILKAMQAHLAQTGTLPSDNDSNPTTGWPYQLARFTNMSPNQMVLDTWGNPRRYIMLTQNETLLGQNIPVYYATVISRGPNLTPTAVTNIIPVTTTGGVSDYGTNTDTGWWKVAHGAGNTPTVQFATAKAGGDDMMVRFTDYTDKINNYNITLQRLQSVAQALETYSRTKYAEALAAGIANASKLIYYPPAVVDGGTSTMAGWAEYPISVKNETTAATGGSYIAATSSSASRAQGLVFLMRILGLPDSYCCSAMEMYTDGSGNRQPMPFFYGSNPRVRTSSGACGGRVNPIATTSTTLPARISTVNNCM